MTEPIRLAETPRFVYRSPECGACGVELVAEDEWTCPVCRTSWPYRASDGDLGSPFEDWEGEPPAPVDEEQARAAGRAFLQDEERRLFIGWDWCPHLMHPGKCGSRRRPLGWSYTTPLDLDAWESCPGGASAWTAGWTR